MTSLTAVPASVCILRSFLTEEEQTRIRSFFASDLAELQSDAKNSKVGLRVETGLATGQSLQGTRYEELIPIARKMFCSSAEECENTDLKAAIEEAIKKNDWTMNVLVYGEHGSMEPHVDAPFTPGDPHKVFGSLNLGLTVRFFAGGVSIPLASGDACVFDAVKTFHGVDCIEPQTSPRNLGLDHLRLGLFFMTASPCGKNLEPAPASVGLDALSDLFEVSSDDSG